MVMKMDIIAFLAALGFFAAVVLEGCSGTESATPAIEGGVPPAPPPPTPPQEVKKPKRVKKAVCQCGENYGCQGGQSWCEKMQSVCGKCKKNCEPNCAWACESPKCTQTCGPKCKAPKCSVRCKGFNTKACRMECGKPNCRVVCPKAEHMCAAKDCAKCKTECSKPVCQVACKKGIGDEQPCRNVCSQPVCQWSCKEPTACPKPKCSMKCEKPQDCMADSLAAGTTPPMEPGETEVATVDVPMGPSPGPAPAASFLQDGSASTFSTNFTTMASDGTLHSGQVKLAMVQVNTVESVATSWVRELREEYGREIEVEASCTNGKFKCEADAAWCAEQKELICQSGSGKLLRKSSQTQGQIQA